MVANRRNRAAAQAFKRQVSLVNGEISIKRVIPSTNLSPTPSPVSTFLFPPSSTPFAPLSAKQPPPLQPPPLQPPPLLSSFADLFKKPHIPPSSKGILPLPASFKPPAPTEGPWITVINKKKARRLRSGPPSDRSAPPLRKRCCLYCGNPNHVAAECKIGTFLCFRCREVGHTSRSCLLTYHSQHSPIPVINLPNSVKENISKLQKFAILSLKKEDPSREELKEMLEYVFKVKEWEGSIIPSSKGTFLIEFPTQDLLLQATSAPSVDMGSFGGRFSSWTESKGLRVFTELIFVWVKISELPYHLWDHDFLSLLFKDVGEIHALSRDVVAEEEAIDCKALLKVKCRQDIPSAIPFRYFSPSSNWMMEGKAVITALGKSATAQQLQMENAFLFYEREGEPSSNFNLGSFSKKFVADLVVNQPLIRPNRDDSPQSLPPIGIPPQSLPPIGTPPSLFSPSWHQG